MAEPTPDLDELDLAIEGLEEAEPVSEAADTGLDIAIDEEPAPGTPPPLARKKPSGPYTGRTHFDDLFASDTNPLPAVRGSLEEKVEYFREKLKRAETQVTRFREAWDIREAEMDTADQALEEERAKSADVIAKFRELEKFIADKKRDFEAYGQKVTQAFAEREAVEQKLKAALEAAREEAQAKTREVAELQEAMERELQARDEEIEARNEVEADYKREVEKRDQLIGRLKEEVGARGERVQELEFELHQRDQAQTKLETNLGVHDQAIEKLKAAVLADRERLKERDQQISTLSEQVSEALAERDAIKAERDKRAEEVRARDQLIEKLKRGVESVREQGKRLEQELAHRDSDLRSKDDELAKKARESEKLSLALEAKRSDPAPRPATGVDRGKLAEVIKRVHKAIEVAALLMAKIEATAKDAVEGRRAASLHEIREIEVRMKKALGLAQDLLKPFG